MTFATLLSQEKLSIRLKMATIADPWRIVYREKQNDYIFKRGRETIYDDENALRSFNSIDEAVAWFANHLPRGRLILDNEKDYPKIKKIKPVSKQLKLF